MSDTDSRAEDARQLQSNALLNAILDQVKQEAIDAWIATGKDDAIGREMSWLLVKAHGRIRDVIQGAIDDQQIAARRAAREPVR